MPLVGGVAVPELRLARVNTIHTGLYNARRQERK